ncbi:PseG/SpsG family protein [Halomontanus rarus]|uniref:PseG/SpsG family protein n=1 Tax=Halomontanus rarus TaxID=3034020 RepID=UPI0023E7FEC9|nr:hypothetical protein [Halovivax sp. TS33]
MHFGIRADGGPKRGFGHLVRMRTLARELLERNHEVTYFTLSPNQVAELCSEEIHIVSLTDDTTDSIIPMLLDQDVDTLIIDHGQIPINDQREFADAFPLALFLDDQGSTVQCDLVVNGHIYASVDEYDWIGEEPLWCVGGDYHMFGADFRHFAQKEPEWNTTPKRALITMGGSDVANTTPDIIRAFDSTDVRIDVIIGPGFQNWDAINGAAAETDACLNLVENPDDLAARLFHTDLAVTALGLTTYELLAMKTPFVGIVQAPDQRPKADPLQKQNVALILDEDYTQETLSDAISTLLTNNKLRRNFFDRGRKIIGIDGATTVADHIEQLK